MFAICCINASLDPLHVALILFLFHVQKDILWISYYRINLYSLKINMKSKLPLVFSFSVYIPGVIMHNSLVHIILYKYFVCLFFV